MVGKKIIDANVLIVYGKIHGACRNRMVLPPAHILNNIDQVEVFVVRWQGEIMLMNEPGRYIYLYAV